MNTFAYSIYDTAAKAFNQPFFLQNDSLAIRAFTDTVNDENSTINKHPQHFALYKIGMFKDDSGELIQDEMKQLLCEAASLHNEQNKRDDLEESIKLLHKKLDEITTVQE